MSYTPNDHEKDYGITHTREKFGTRDGIYPLRKTGKANYDRLHYKKLTVGNLPDKDGMVAGFYELLKIQAICYNCHKFIGKMEETSMNNKIGLCMGECTFD